MDVTKTSDPLCRMNFSGKRIAFMLVVLAVLMNPCPCCTDADCEDDYLGVCQGVAACLDEYARKLSYKLFEANSYNPLIRPVKNTTDSLTINFTLALSTIINVDSKNQFIVTNVWLDMRWNDFQMIWDPKDYSMINETRITMDRIWVPDIVLFNNADGMYEPSFIPNVLVYADGKMKFIPPSIYTSSCSIDVEYFPFDQQKCEMKFGSWTFAGNTLTYQFQWGQSMMDLTNYMRSGAWNIISCQGRIQSLPDALTGEPKEFIIYDLVIRRKTLFYLVNLIIPCFLHALVCLCVFVLPADGCEKMTLTISVLVSLVVFLVLVQKILPPSIKIPLIAKYFLFTFIMNVLEILVTVSIIFANHKSPRTDTMPKWVCWLFLYKLPKYLFMERPDHDERWSLKTCDEPPSYPSTPQLIPRASIIAHAPNVRMGLAHLIPSLPPILQSDIEDDDRSSVSSLRKDFKMTRSSGCSTRSSMGSGSQMSGEYHIESSAGAEVAENMMLDPRCSGHPPPAFRDHPCMLRDDHRWSIDTLDERVKGRGSDGRGGGGGGGGRGGGVGGGRGFGARPRSPQTVQSQEDAANDDVTTDEVTPPFWMIKEVYSAMNAVKFIWRQMQNQDEYETVKEDWKYVGAVLDRLLMVVFILVTVGGTIGCLINAPHILETVDEEEILDRIRRGEAV